MVPSASGRTALLKSPIRSRVACCRSTGSVGFGVVLGHTVKPSWRFVVNITYFAPALWKTLAQLSGFHLVATELTCPSFAFCWWKRLPGPQLPGDLQGRRAGPRRLGQGGVSASSRGVRFFVDGSPPRRPGPRLPAHDGCQNFRVRD